MSEELGAGGAIVRVQTQGPLEGGREVRGGGGREGGGGRKGGEGRGGRGREGGTEVREGGREVREGGEGGEGGLHVTMYVCSRISDTLETTYIVLLDCLH